MEVLDQLQAAERHTDDAGPVSARAGGGGSREGSDKTDRAVSDPGPASACPYSSGVVITDASETCGTVM